VAGICCASACTTPAACQLPDSPTCPGGSTCVYKPDTTMEGMGCDDGNACTTGETCQSGQCVGATTVSCDDHNPCTDDTCDTTLGCKNQNNTATCDDGDPCTVSDTCAGGLCHGSPMVCTSQDDVCNVGVCAAGTCGKSPRANTTPCDDGKACTTTDLCNNGTCTGTVNSCGANASACAEGPPKSCTCNTNFVSTNGQCVPATNECAPTNPCVAGATCNDPSSATGDYVCTCPTGFTGDGKPGGTGCTQIDNCVGNPCGAGGTCVNGINTHTCNCSAGNFSVNGVCVCNMNGTFASQISMTISWPEIDLGNTPLFSAATNVPTKQWAIRQQTYDSTGQLVITTTSCGGTTADLCGITAPLNKAYTEFLPSGIYGGANMPVQTLTIPLPNAVAGQPYTEPQSAALLGISLTDPLGAWPASNANVGVGATGTGGQTNGAVWVDNDNDKFAGVTAYSVPVGGIDMSTQPLPIETYPATSTQCGTAYDLLLQVKRVYTAQRTISSMSGTISSCDSITGTLGGPDTNNMPKSDARVDGCIQASGTSEAPCSDNIVSSFDGQNQTQHVTSASFILKRVDSSVTCAQVRAMTFP
jgi:EGF-like domain